MTDKTLVGRLDILIKDDHERGCQGRYYSCTCGYDNDCSQAMQDAKLRIEALEAALRFYARENSWKSCGVYMCGHSQPSSAEVDRGNKARKALESKP